MSKLLYIKANAKAEGESRTFKISDKFIESYLEHHPNDTVITLDLYEEDIKPLSTEDLNTVFGPKTNDNRYNSVLKYTYQFAEVDKYVVAAPMWNLSIPAILKTYIDYVCVTGVTFRYTAQGPLGMLENKRAVHITTRGGEYSDPAALEFELGDRYLKTIFAFLGITDFTTIAADGLDIQGNDVNALVNNAIIEAEEMARNF